MEVMAQEGAQTDPIAAERIEADLHRPPVETL